MDATQKPLLWPPQLLCIKYVFVVLAIRIICINSWCQAEKLHCVPDTTILVHIDPSQPQDSSNNIYPYARDLMGSMEVRHCHWRISFVGLRHRAHLALERLASDSYSSLHPPGWAADRGMSFAQILDINVSLTGNCSSRQLHEWDKDHYFHLISLHSETDFLDITMHLDSPERLRLSNLFYLRISHSVSGICSRGLVAHEGSCLAIRKTDKLAQAAAFGSVASALSFLKAYADSAALGVMGYDEHKIAKHPVRLAMSFCNISDRGQQLVYWRHFSNGTCGCASLQLGNATLMQGRGECLSVLAADPRTGSPRFKPVPCQGVMATLLGFPVAPAGSDCVGGCGGGGCGGGGGGASDPAAERCGPDLLRNSCCGEVQQPTSPDADADWWKPPVKAAAVIVAILLGIVCIVQFCKWFRGNRN